jgi:putative aldouronate transport system permease protein
MIRKKRRDIRLGSPVFDIINYAFLLIVAAICILPIINVLAISFSASASVAAGRVTLFPIGFNIESYKYAMAKPQFRSSFMVSVTRTVLGLVINLACTVLTAYPLSKTNKELTGRDVYAWYFFLTMIFGRGLVPWYLTIKQFGLIDSIWALILPGALPVFNAIILMNFIKQLPAELSESASIDGAGHFTVLFKIVLPLSLPSLATISLFTIIGHWNDWFSGLILINSPDKYPLQTYLQSIVVVRDTSTLSSASRETLEMLAKVSDRTLKSSQIFIAAMPVMLIYPFMQKYFMKGLVLGSVKG